MVEEDIVRVVHSEKMQPEMSAQRCPEWNMSRNFRNSGRVVRKDKGPALY